MEEGKNISAETVQEVTQKIMDSVKINTKGQLCTPEIESEVHNCKGKDLPAQGIGTDRSGNMPEVNRQPQLAVRSPGLRNQNIRRNQNGRRYSGGWPSRKRQNLQEGEKMKLNDVYTKPLKDIVEQMTLTDMKVHTDDAGDVKSIELKYEPEKQRS